MRVENGEHRERAQQVQEPDSVGGFGLTHKRRHSGLRRTSRATAEYIAIPYR
jgi:hypothetical protein